MKSLILILAVLFVSCGNVSAAESAFQEFLSNNTPWDIFLIIFDFIPLWIWYLAVWIISFFIPAYLTINIENIYMKDTGKMPKDNTGNSAQIYMGCIFASLNCILFTLLLN